MSNMIPFGSRSLIDEFFRDVSPGFFIKPLQGDPMPTQIKIEVREDKESYTLCAELPGLDKNDIQVTAEGNIVAISAEVKQEDRQVEGSTVLRSERYYGAVSRRVQLPREVDIAQASAKYENGILTLTLPKKASASSRQLSIT